MEVKNIKIVDVTLREGDQAPLTSFNAQEKSMIALMLSEMGVDVIEVGFGFSRADFENIKKVSSIVGNRKTRVSSLGRALESDTIASLEALIEVENPRIHIFLAMSKDHINGKFAKAGATLEERQDKLLIQAKTEIERAKNWAIENSKSLEIEFSPEDATGNSLKDIDGKKIFQLKDNSDFGFLIKVCEEAIKCGATILNIPDTLGNLLPHQSYEFFKETGERLEYLKKDYDFGLSCHIHNDLAMSTANAIESVRGGADFIETTILGIGERAGNTVTHEIIGILKEKGHNLIDGKIIELNNNFKYELSGPITDFVKNVVGVDKYLQTSFIGALSDIDGSGVHNANGDLYGGSKDKRTYGGANLPEFFSPRGGANQIVNMLAKFGIEEEKRSEIISKVTTIAAKKSEILKAMFDNNIYTTYLEEKGDFKINKLEINNNELNLIINLKGQEIIFNGEIEGENGIINTFINLLNQKLGKDFVKVNKLEIKSKPSLKQEYELFCEKIKKYNIELSNDFYSQAEKILNIGEKDDEYSEAKAVSHVILEVNGKEIYSVASDKNVTIGNIKAILEGVINVL